MDLGSALNSIMEYDIKKHCHINTNEDGDRFVGIKADSDNAMVYFPIGYELPETDAEIRTDIKHLIQVLSEFTTKDDRLLAINKFAAPQTVDFPINAYKSVIEYYFSIGGTYYVEKEQVYITAPTGKQDWARTARKQMPLVQSRNGVSYLGILHNSLFARTSNRDFLGNWNLLLGNIPEFLLNYEIDIDWEKLYTIFTEFLNISLLRL